ncbi:MAG: tRNA-specific 2-thiouridylase, partial [Gammaproteobacteria bacterium]|nr:tRNA-specific 2-thiouridylase [Gammaproteobacteria bacterium]
TLFPLGLLEKSAVRRLARDYGLAIHARPDSTGICFVGERPFRDFLAEHLEPAPGPILDSAGQQLGEHIGLPFYTLGQREGLQVGGRSDSLQLPWFVAVKDAARNTLVVVQGQDHPWLFRQDLRVADLRWLNGEPAGLADGLEVHARIRHRHAPARCHVMALPGGRVGVRFELPQRAPAPGQYVVFYQGDECLGGGVILEGDAVPGVTMPVVRATAAGKDVEWIVPL